MRGKILRLFVIFVFLTSCGSGGKSDRGNLRSYFLSGQIQKAHEVLDQSKDYQGSNNEILLWLEKALLFLSESDYQQSIEYLEKAKERTRDLYKTRLSGTLKSLVTNDNYDLYYGETFERSLIHYYLALNHYLIAQTGILGGKQMTPSEISKSYRRARSEMIDWNSTLETFQVEKMGDSVFKNDLLHKVFGGYIHEAIGGNTDLQIAFQLYKDARDLLFSHYATYKTFNINFLKFKKDFQANENLGSKNIPLNFFTKTAFAQGLEDYLDYKILSLAKKIRPHEISQLKEIYKPSSAVLSRLSEVKTANIGVLIEHSMIPDKVPEKYYFGLDPDHMKTGAGKAMALIGHAALTAFAIDKLKIGRPAKGWTPSSSAIGVKTTALTAQYASIDFELPKVDNRYDPKEMFLLVTDLDGKALGRFSLAMLNPMGDIAEEAVAEKSAWRYARIGSRLAIKFAAAIATAYFTYKSLEEKQGAFLAQSIAFLGFVGATKTIKASEQADTRYWSLLPAGFLGGDFYLPKGEYVLYLQRNTQQTKLGNLSISNDSVRKLLNFRIKS